MGGWRKLNGLTGIKRYNLCVNEGTHLSCKDIYSHVKNQGKKCKYHNIVQQYLFHCYNNYYGSGMNHHGIISKSRHEYALAEGKNVEMFKEMNERRLRRQKYQEVKFVPVNPTNFHKVNTSNSSTEQFKIGKPANDKVWQRKGRSWGDKVD